MPGRNTMKQQWFRAPQEAISKAEQMAAEDGLSLSTVLRMLLVGYTKGEIHFSDIAFKRELQRGK